MPFAHVNSAGRLAEDQEVLRLSASKKECWLGLFKITWSEGELRDNARKCV
jgi:hypothetical protein